MADETNQRIFQIHHCETASRQLDILSREIASNGHPDPIPSRLIVDRPIPLRDVVDDHFEHLYEVLVAAESAIAAAGLPDCKSHLMLTAHVRSATDQARLLLRVEWLERFETSGHEAELSAFIRDISGELLDLVHDLNVLSRDYHAEGVLRFREMAIRHPSWPEEPITPDQPTSSKALGPTEETASRAEPDNQVASIRRALKQPEIEAINVLTDRRGEHMTSDEIGQLTKSGYGGSTLRKYLPDLVRCGLIKQGKGKRFFTD